MAIKEVEKLGKDGRALMGKGGERIAVIRVFALLRAHPPHLRHHSHCLP